MQPSTTGHGWTGGPCCGWPRSPQQQLHLPARTVTARIECAGNGRSFFTSQQNQAVSGTPWQLGAVGVARWRGVPLATVLDRAGLRRAAVDVLPQGLDPDYVTGGINLGPVRSAASRCPTPRSPRRGTPPSPQTAPTT